MGTNSIPSFLILCITLLSCLPSSDRHREEDKIFHASLPDHGVAGGLYFGLYKDLEYQICSSGGISQNCYSGSFIINSDTLTLLNLPSEIELSSNRFLIIKTNQPEGKDLGKVIPIIHSKGPNKALDNSFFIIKIDSPSIHSSKALAN